MHARYHTKTKRIRGFSGLSVARPGLRRRKRKRDFFQPLFSVLILGAGFTAVVLVFPIQLVGEMDSVCLFEQNRNPRSSFVFLYYAGIGIHHITHSTLQAPRCDGTSSLRRTGVAQVPYLSLAIESALNSSPAFMCLNFV